MYGSHSEGRRKTGATLVEVVMAGLLLALLAVAGGAYLYHSRATIAAQRDKRAALDAANSMLEAVRASNYDDVKPPDPPDYGMYYLSVQGGAWFHSTSDPGDTVVINGKNLPRETTVQYVDVDGGAPSYDCLRLIVNVGYRLNSADRVALETLYAP